MLKYYSVFLCADYDHCTSDMSMYALGLSFEKKAISVKAMTKPTSVLVLLLHGYPYLQFKLLHPDHTC